MVTDMGPDGKTLARTLNRVHEATAVHVAASGAGHVAASLAVENFKAGGEESGG